MKKIASGLLAVAATAVLAGNAHAQVPNVTPLSIEVRGGAAFPQGDLKDGLDTGYNLGANVTYNFVPALGVYAGYSLSKFSMDGVDEVKFNDRGFDAGLRLSVPTPMIPIDPFVKAGLIYHQIELDGDGGNLSLDSKFGFEVGAGLGFNILPKVQLTPAVTYSQFKADFDDEEEFGSGDVDIKNMRVDIGVRVRI